MIIFLKTKPKLKTSRLKLSLVELIGLRSEKHEFFAVLGSYCCGQMFLLPFQVVIVAAKCSFYRSRLKTLTHKQV
ncbi:hypothetical protein BpHYR1_039776 [Brachionus plicatilis]|uniref:Uncharacterized protein n=1 Tax=Brachionus plicatilis TaxID=10195 RepID=A0A3M7SL87_BRAPC|nr:hypothetical protein BpHYR1_039776 [Brachionus plicatilis]